MNGFPCARDALAAVAAPTRPCPHRTPVAAAEPATGRPTGDASTADRPAVNGFPCARDALAAVAAPTRPGPHRTPVAAAEPATGRSSGDGTTGGRPGGSRAVPVGAVS
ncbi:hypothetical protein [Streptomyces fungicidicus]|uniref:hypothetical protein n=1 Tax=Streptomyces fungicidicus TaxID=68203 RepID=UPI0036EE70C5